MTIKTSLATPVVHKQPQNVLRDEDRTVTDRKYSVIFYIILTIWLASCICVLYCASEMEPEQREEAEQLNELRKRQKHEKYNPNNMTRLKEMFLFYMSSKHSFDTYYREIGSAFIWQSMLYCSFLIVLGNILIGNAVTKHNAALISMSSLLIIVSIIYRTGNYFFNDDLENWGPILKRLIFWIGPEAVFVILSFLALSVYSCFAGSSKTGKSLKESFSYYLTCRYLVLPGFLVCFIILSLNLFTRIVLNDLTGTSVDSSTMYWIIYSGSFYMIILTYTLGRMTISATAATYYGDKDHEQSPFKIMCQKIHSIFKFNFGSACGLALYSSFVFIIIFGIIMEYDFSEDYPAKYCSIFYLMFLLNFDVTSYFTSIYNLRISQAFKKLCVFYLNDRLFPSSCQSIWLSAFLIVVATNCMMLFLMWGINEDNPMFSSMSYSYLFEILFYFLPVVLVFGIIEDTRYMCQIDEETALSDQQSSLEETMVDEKLQVLVEKPAEVMVNTN